MRTLKRVTKQVKDIINLHKKNMENTKDDYMVGMYNGMELVLAMLENRKPVFEDCTQKEPEVIEHDEAVERTIMSGIRHRGGSHI